MIGQRWVALEPFGYAGQDVAAYQVFVIKDRKSNDTIRRHRAARPLSTKDRRYRCVCGLEFVSEDARRRHGDQRHPEVS